LLEKHYQYINELVLAVQNGDADAVTKLQEFYQPLIHASIARCIEREPDLRNRREDVESEIYLILQKLIEKYDPSLSYFSYYLSTRLDYAILNRCRQSILGLKPSGIGIDEICFTEMPEDWEPESSDDPFGKIRTAVAINNALDQLKPTQREALQLYYFENMNQEAAAAALNITQSSFCKRLQRALAHMRILLSDDFLL
jgi:RNA polymerase sigma factor (sigma-70 family)